MDFKKTSIRKNSFANAAGQIYAIFIGIVILPAYMAYLGPESFGLIGFFTMVSTWMMMLDVGLSQTISREASRLRLTKKDLIEFKLVLRSVESVFLALALISVVLVLLYSESISNSWLQVELLDKNDVSYCVSLMGFMFASKWLVSLYRGALNGFERQIWVNGFSIIVNSFKFIGGFLLVKYYAIDIIIYFEYQLLISLIELLVINKRLYQEIPEDYIFVMPSFLTIKRIAPFALGIAYTSGLWIAVSQVDKLLLSHLLPLKEYGFFSLVVVISGGLMMLSAPIGTAVRPRMTLLISQGKHEEMLSLYRKATQFVAVLGFSVTGVISLFSTELIYLWTGNMGAAHWGGPILSWYALGNGVLLILAFQYYLQFAYGNLKYHIRGNTYFGLVQVICMILAAYNYGAIGTAITWFALQLFFISFWPAYIHSKFAPGLHRKWLSKDVIPPLVSTIFGLGIVSLIDVDIESHDRLQLFLIFTSIWITILSVNVFFTQKTREFALGLINAYTR